jgi:hypothetical protein
MIKQDIQNVVAAVRSLNRGDKETAASYLYAARTKTRSRQIKELAYALSDLHKLAPYTEAMLKERKEWQERLDRMAATAQNQMEKQA